MLFPSRNLPLTGVTLWKIIFTAVFVIYTLLGGQFAIIRTDALQAVIIFGGIFGGMAMLLSHLGGWQGLQNSLPAEMFSFPLNQNFGGADLTSMLLVVGLTYVVGPDMYTRIFCARDGEVARKSTLWAGGLLVPFAFAIAIIGMGAAVLFPDIAAEQAFPTVIKEVLPPVVGGIVLAALLCAVMSSADTCLLSASTILTVDIIKKFKPTLGEGRVLALSRWMILLIGAGAMLVAWKLGGVISSLLFAYTVYTSGLILPVLFGF